MKRAHPSEGGGPPPPLVDTHAHVMDRRYDADRAAVLERARQADVGGVVCVGYDLPTSRAAVALAREHGWLRAAVGLHPNDVARVPAAAFDEIASLARQPFVVAIGETGLDYYRQATEPARQQDALAWHLELAQELRLPVIIHNRDADRDIAPRLEASAARRPAGDIPGVLHCYSSTDLNFLERMVGAGYFVSFAGTLTFRGAEALRRIAPRVPPERLLVETDCPYLAPEPYRGKRNEPAFVRATAERLAQIVGASWPTFQDLLWTNTTRIFPSLAPLAEGAGEEP